MSWAVREAGGFPGGARRRAVQRARNLDVLHFIMTSGSRLFETIREFNKRTRDLFNRSTSPRRRAGASTAPIRCRTTRSWERAASTTMRCCASTSASRTPSTQTASSRPAAAGLAEISRNRSDDETSSVVVAALGLAASGAATPQEIGEAPTFGAARGSPTLTDGRAVYPTGAGTATAKFPANRAPPHWRHATKQPYRRCSPNAPISVASP